MTVAIFVWKPDWRDHSDGHASMVNHFYELERKTYISWWPLGNMGLDGKTTASGTKGSPRRTFQDDRLGEGNGKDRKPDWALTLDGLDEDKIQKYWKQLHNDRYEWDMYRFNCSSVVYHALRAGGATAKLSNPIRPMDIIHYSESLKVALAHSKKHSH